MPRKFVCIGLWMLMALVACTGQSPTVTSTPLPVSPTIIPVMDSTFTLAPTESASSTPLPTATRTASPTPTSNPMIVQGDAFALPILEEVATRRPDWQDDFSRQNQGWSFGQIPLDANNGWGGGRAGYQDGVYFVSVPPGTSQQIQSPFGARFANLVFEIDSRFASNAPGSYEIHVRHQSPPRMGYIVAIFVDGRMSITKYIAGEAPSMLVEAEPPSLLSGMAANHIQVVARGGEIAVLANGELALYVLDPNYERDSGSGSFNLVAHNWGNYEQTVFLDNIKLWILPK